MHKPIFKDCLHDNTLTLSQSHQSHELSLDICRKPRVWMGFCIDSFYRALSEYPHFIFFDFNTYLALLKLQNNRFYMLRNTVFNSDIPLCDCSCNHKGSRFDSIRKNSTFYWIKRTGPLDSYNIGSLARNFCSS